MFHSSVPFSFVWFQIQSPQIALSNPSAVVLSCSSTDYVLILTNREDAALYVAGIDTFNENPFFPSYVTFRPGLHIQ